MRREAKLKIAMLFPLHHNPLYIGGHFHCYMLDKSISHFRGVKSIFFTFILCLMESPVSKQCRP